ncbi:MAG TPA: hypothetical protein VFP93_01895, partial [Gammaproteobacteria bacterium]|nr:hypothetical protein [Gammaproteobacteria bacterium]
TYSRYLDKIPLGVYLKTMHTLFHWHGANALDNLYTLGILGSAFFLHDINYDLSLQPKMYNFWHYKLSKAILDPGNLVGLILILPLTNRLLHDSFKNALDDVIEEFLNHWNHDDEASKHHLACILKSVLPDYLKQYQLYQVPNLSNNFSQLNTCIHNSIDIADYEEIPNISSTSFIPHYTKQTQTLNTISMGDQLQTKSVQSRFTN